MSSQRRGGSFLVVPVLLITIFSLVHTEAASAANKADADERAVKIKHAGEQDGWQIAETTNFRLYHQHPRALAEEVLKSAERARAAQMNKWFGKVGGEWEPKCRICLYPSGEAYGEATGAPVNPYGGHTDVRAEGERVLSRSIHLHGTRAFLLNGVVPHEVTHAVMAGRLSDGRVPRWADEGMAILAEARKNIDVHLRYLPRMRTDGVLYSMRTLIEMRDYPEPRGIGVFYAQSVSLVDFLCREKGAERFASFVRDGERDGYEESLGRHYGWSFEELERHWQRRTFYRKKSVEAAAEAETEP